MKNGRVETLDKPFIKGLYQTVLCNVVHCLLWTEKTAYQVYNESHILSELSLVILLCSTNQLTWPLNPIWTLLYVSHAQSEPQSWSRDTSPQRSSTVRDALATYASVQRTWNTGRGARKPLCTYVHFSIVIGHKNNWYSSSQCHHKQSSGPSEYVRILRKHSDLQINQYTTITSYWLYMYFPQFLSNSLAKNEISITSPWAQIIEEICEMAWENPSVEFWKTDNDEKSGFDHNFVFIPEIYLEIFTFIPPKQNLFLLLLLCYFLIFPRLSMCKDHVV